MPLTIVRQESATRFQEVQTFLSSIKISEPQHRPVPIELNTQKGLLLVLLYGAFEYSITRMLTEVAQLINARHVSHEHIHHLLYPLALDSELSAVSMAGRRFRWQRRMELFQRQLSSEPVQLREGTFVEEMENVWAKTVQEVFRVFGVAQPALYDIRVRQYVDEVVGRRNAIAHGRESAAVVGQAYTSGRLQMLLDELSAQTQYMFAAFDTYLVAKIFIKTDHHPIYE